MLFVYSHPQIASVGLGEENARKSYDIIVGRTKYFDVAKGEAMIEKDGFAKAIVEKGSDRILGFHIIGPYAPVLIQEVVNAISGPNSSQEILCTMVNLLKKDHIIYCLCWILVR